MDPDVIIIHLLSQLLLFIKNECKGAINLTTLASSGYLVIAVGYSLVSQMMHYFLTSFDDLEYQNISLCTN